MRMGGVMAKKGPFWRIAVGAVVAGTRAMASRMRPGGRGPRARRRKRRVKGRKQVTKGRMPRARSRKEVTKGRKQDKD